MALVVKGRQTFTEQPKKRTWTPETGWTTTREWQGPNTDSVVRAKEDAVIALGAQSIDTDTSIPAVITAKFTDLQGGVQVQDDDYSERNAVWELIKMEVEKSLASFPRWNSATLATAMVQAVEIARIDKAIKDGTCNPATETDPYDSYATLKLLGTESYITHIYTIRKSYSLSKASQKQLTFDNTGKVVSYQEIGYKPGGGIPSTVKWKQPRYSMPSESTTGSFTFTSPINQWLESAPDIRYNEATKKTDITVEWVGQQKWSKTLYSGGSHIP